ncbi:MAG: transglutaminase-like domain-containing protein [Planctomycetota bacterium]|nr:transglutaminase-like domain-containing protein [Planctomycetota bacterium]
MTTLGMLLRVLTAASVLFLRSDCRGGEIPEAKPGERWYIVEIDGRQAGWSRSVEEAGPGGSLVSRTEMDFTMERMGQRAAVRMRSEFVETATGEPVRMSSAQSSGGAETTQTWTFIPGIAGYEVRLESRQGPDAEPVVTTLEWPGGEWLTPGKAREFVKRELAAGSPSFAYETVDPTVGLAPVRIEYRRVERTQAQTPAGPVNATELEVRNSAVPGATGRDTLDDAGEIVRSEMDFGGLKMVIRASDRATALKPFAPPELMARTLVTPEGKAIERPRALRRAVYVLSRADGGAMPDVPSVGGQRAERLDAGRVRVTVERGRVSLEDPPAAGAEDAALGRSLMIDPQDAAVGRAVELMESQLKAAGDVGAARAPERRAADFVGDYVADDTLDVGLATAVETARTRRGDCTEHAVLLAAVLRARGVGARVASGLVYVTGPDGRGVFGFHMWTQARSLDNGRARWIDCDAAIIPEGDEPGVDATHIALGVSVLGEGDVVGAMGGLAALLGNLKIQVEHAE